MIRSLLLGAVVLTSSTVAHADKVYDLPTVPITLKYGTFEYDGFRVVGPTPLLSARINTLMDGFWARQGFISFAAGLKGSVVCHIGVATNVMISVGCENNIVPDMPSGGGNSGTYGATLLIKGDRVVDATADDLFGPAKDQIAALTGKNDQPPAFTCGLDWEQGSLYVTSSGIETNGMQTMGACAVDWSEILPLLPKDSLLRAVNASTGGTDPRRTWKQDRFVVTAGKDGETAVDKASGLEWATHDNGADIDFAGAEAYAKASKLGGHTDWRLPTESEIEQLSELTGQPHVEKTDCTKGKNQLMVSPVIHLSCGLAWTKTGDVQMGFISGTPREVKPTVKVNSRALLVRGTRN